MRNKFSNPVQDALGKPKLLIFPCKQDHLQIITMRGKRTEMIAVVNLKEDYTCKLGCSHWKTDYCECRCHGFK